jgi:biotin operon repressor
METSEKVMKVMQKAKAPMSAGQVAEQSGIDRKEVDKAMKVLQTTGKIVSPKRCYWEPAK